MDNTNKKLIYFVVFISTTTLTACEKPFAAGNTLNTTAAKFVIPREQIADFNLSDVIMDDMCATFEKIPECINISNGEKYNVGLGKAYAMFRNKYLDLNNPAKARAARNGIQYRIITAANHHCGEFQVKVTEIGTTSGFGAGIIGATAGTLGAFATSGAAQWLSATAGLASSVDGTVHSILLKEKTGDVLVSGVNIGLEKINNEQIGDKRDKNIENYTLEMAIDDAIRYNQACSINQAFDNVTTALAKQGKSESASESQNRIDLSKKIAKLDKEKLEKLIAIDRKAPSGAGAKRASGKDISDDDWIKKVIILYTKDIMSANDARLKSLPELLGAVEA